MAIPVVGSGLIGQSAALQKYAATQAQSANGQVPFADLVKGMVEQTGSQQEVVQENLKEMISGEPTSIHDIVLNASRADLAFRLVMEVRNRLISSYQEIMRMQV